MAAPSAHTSAVETTAGCAADCVKRPAGVTQVSHRCHTSVTQASSHKCHTSVTQISHRCHRCVTHV
eukprot:6345829-Pyramimonas_sp.AAC.1